MDADYMNRGDSSKTVRCKARRSRGARLTCEVSRSDEARSNAAEDGFSGVSDCHRRCFMRYPGTFWFIAMAALFTSAGCITAPSLPEKPDAGDIETKQEVVDAQDVEAELEIFVDADVEIAGDDGFDAEVLPDAPDVPDVIDAEAPFDADIEADILDAADAMDADIQDGYDAGDTGPQVIVLKRLTVFSGSVKGESANMKAKGGAGQPSPVNESQNSEGSTASYGFYNW